MSKKKITQNLNNVSGGKSKEFEVHKKISKTYQIADPLDNSTDPNDDKKNYGYFNCEY